MATYRVALSGDFVRPDGAPAFPMFDLEPLRREPGVELRFVEPVDGVMRAEDLAGTDALILLVPRFDARSIPADGRLRLVARFGVGYDAVDLDACTRAGIAVSITPDGVRRPVATTILTLLLALTSKLLVKDRLTRMGPQGWARRAEHMGTGLTGRTFGQLGIGNIGAEALRLLAPLEMRLIAHDPYADPRVAEALGVRLVDLDALFREADVVSIGVPLTPATRGLVDARLIGLMKPDAYLINTARGPIVDQAALVAALRERRIAGAGLDVFAVEPTPADDPILALDNVVLAPHALCWTDECFAGIGAADVRAVLAAKAGRIPAGVVNREALEHPHWRGRPQA